MERRDARPKFRRRVRDLLARGGRSWTQPVTSASATRRPAPGRQEQVDRGIVAGLRPEEAEERATAKRPLRDLEDDLEVHRRAKAVPRTQDDSDERR